MSSPAAPDYGSGADNASIGMSMQEAVSAADAMANALAFATLADIQANWRPDHGGPLLPEECGWAQTLLNQAGIWIRGRKAAAGQTIADGDPAARIVSIDVVRAALRRDEFPGVHSGTHTVDGRSDTWSGTRNATVEDIARTLVFSDYQWQLLGLWGPTEPVATFGNIRRDIDPPHIHAPLWPWFGEWW